MTHILNYIGGDDNTYVTGSDGNSPSDKDYQTVLIGDTVSIASIGEKQLAEQTTEHVHYPTESHQYNKFYGGEWVPDSGVFAARMPKYLTGWQRLINGQLSDVGSFQINAENIAIYFPNEASVLNLYGKWETPRLIRVVIYEPKGTQGLSLKYNVAITADDSYNPNDTYHLTDNFKTIYDNGTVTGADLDITDLDQDLLEYGEGDGCMHNGTVTYYAIKSTIPNSDEDSITISISPISGYVNNYIPAYQLSGNSVEYYYYQTDYLVRIINEWTNNTLYKNALAYNSNTGFWQTRIEDIDTDKTIFVPMIPKPQINVTVYPLNSGTVTGLSPGGIYMPGDTCSLTAVPDSTHIFSRWAENNATLTNNANYGFTVTGSRSLVAEFVPLPSLWVSYYAGDSGEGTLLSGTVLCKVPASGISYTVTNTPRQYFFGNGTQIRLEATKYPYTDYYHFDGWYNYVGNQPSPNTDTIVAEDSSSTNIVSYLYITIGNQETKYYARYVRN